MVRQKIEKAVDLYQKCGKAVLEDPCIVFLINNYNYSIKRTFFSMNEAGIIEACSSCAGVHTSGCCFSGVEEWYDCHLLFINLLLERDLPVKADYPESCLFVGENGCKLIARHSFCVNFLCPGLLKGLAQNQKKTLLKTVGHELQAGWELEKVLRRIINF